MKATYYKDTMRSYMIIPCPEEAETAGYQYRMLEMNRIEGLLPCGLRHIDGKRYLYYDITGKQSVLSLFEGRRISGTDVFKLIKGIEKVSEAISRYLLDEQHLVLSEEQVFYDLQAGSFYFTYYPGEVVPAGIFRFLVDSVDGTDKSAAAAVYRLSSAAGSSRQALREAIREEAADKTEQEKMEAATQNRKSRIEVQNSDRPGDLRIGDFMDTGNEGGEPDAETTVKAGRLKKAERNEEHSSDINRTEKENTGPVSSLNTTQLIVRILLILLALCGSGGLIAVQFLLYISRRERRLCIAGAILLIIMAILVLAELIIRFRKERARKKEEARNSLPSYSKSDESDFPICNIKDTEDYRIGDDENGNTVKFNERESTGRLYGRERGNRIDLRTLPVTIGKAQSYADVILSDPSISRVHARIYKGEEGSIEIRDLDSTNGTWINGIRLMPNEKGTVHRGDEVRFGNMEYEYR